MKDRWTDNGYETYKSRFTSDTCVEASHTTRISWEPAPEPGASSRATRRQGTNRRRRQHWAQSPRGREGAPVPRQPLADRWERWPDRAEPSRAEPSRAEPSQGRAEPSRVGPRPSRAEPSARVGPRPSGAEPGRPEPSRAGPGQAERSRAEPSRAGQSGTQPKRKRTSQPSGTGGVRGADA